MYVLVPTD